MGKIGKSGEGAKVKGTRKGGGAGKRKEVQIGMVLPNVFPSHR